MAEQIYLVAGATGGVGQQIVSRLLRQSKHVRALVRDRDKGRALLGENLELFEGDTRRIDTMQTAMNNVTIVLCATGTRAMEGPNSPEFVDYEGVRHLVQAAQNGSVDRFVLISSLGVTHPEHTLNRFGRVLDWKLKGEAMLRASGLSYTVVRPGGLNDEPGGKTALMIDQGDRISGRISRADLAEVCLRTLDVPSSIGTTFEVIAAEGPPPQDWAALFDSLQKDQEVDATAAE